MLATRLLSSAPSKASLLLAARRTNPSLSQPLQLALLSTSMAASKNVAVVLAGCGVYDGSEVHEASAVLAALTRNGCEPVIVAPDSKQAHVVDHTKGAEMEEERNVLLGMCSSLF